MRRLDYHQKVLFIILLILTCISGCLLLAVVSVTNAYDFWVMQAGDDAYVVCENGYLQTDHTLPGPRPTPTSSPYPGPSGQYQTSVYIKCTSEEPTLLSVRQRTMFPVITNDVIME